MRTEPLRHALLVALLLASGSAAADWKREYDRGLKAIDDGNWSEAEARFAQALREDGTPAERKRFEGVRFNHYVPHYFAGLAAFRAGDCAKAVEYWSHAPTDAVLGKLSELRAEQQRGLATCRTRLAQAAPPPATPATATAPASTTTPASTAPSTAASTTRPPSTGTPTTPATGTPQRPVASTAPTAPPPVATTRPPASTTAPATTAQSAAGGTAPALLRSTVEAYLAGRYADVQRVDASAAADSRARAQLHLLRAAAAFTLANVNGDGDAALEAARREVRAARAVQGNLSPDPVLFSPRFRSFWQQTR